MGCPVYTPRRRTFFSQNLGSKQHTLAFSHTCEAQLVVFLLHILGRSLSVVMVVLVKVSKNVLVPGSITPECVRSSPFVASMTFLELSVVVLVLGMLLLKDVAKAGSTSNRFLYFSIELWSTQDRRYELLW